MARKFVGTREVKFINSITRELHQHVVDEEVLYYSIDLAKTRVDDLYNEAIKKTWAAPVKITARVLYDNMQTRQGLFGGDSQYQGEIYFHTQELIERNVNPREGDFIEYGQQYWEITSVSQPQLIFGQINNKLMTKCHLVPSRQQQFQNGANSAQNLDHSHPIDNKPSFTRKMPEDVKPTYAPGSTAKPPFTDEE